MDVLPCGWHEAAGPTPAKPPGASRCVFSTMILQFIPIARPTVCFGFSVGVVTPTLVLVVLLGSGRCCPDMCTCTGNTSDCSGLDLMTLTPLLPMLDQDCMTLRLHRNNLSTLVSVDWSNLSGLEVLDIAQNRLSGLPSGAFSDLGSLRWLNLSGNLLGEHLTTANIDWSQEVEWGLDREAFKGLRWLLGLDLSSNALPWLPTGLLDGLQRLRWLSLARNRLAVLERATFEPARGLKQLLLAGNPWHCDCKMRAFKHWMEWMLYRDGLVDAVTCSLPRSLSGRDIRGVPAEMLAHCTQSSSGDSGAREFASGDPSHPSCPPGRDCVRQRYRPLSVRRARGTQIVAGVVCGTVCIMMAVAATYGCVYASLMARYQKHLNHRGQPLMERSGPDADPEDGLLPEETPPKEACVVHGYRISSF
ncbi:leucine-rich repeat and transmembrane domain-containing protein 2-like isoform X1 [Syngnathus scovelli]|uniref:leucine-rich repeat and transmembrane domain-containing protein 2-like isoform X1 n=1 Tax=Syngnathus scovelli TaxID=161590 RepID=UPI002110810E|nr:leucine-rich repeat and transmembrane domain-containing protein 2-like isoform X2 [Syngnathus scovelli]